ncbi:hypothetical protein JL722_5913 [Aureococcus anophagefferens]|nr:hypothetical protein JL722_5913 [Aureococcus anophagefferens]
MRLRVVYDEGCVAVEVADAGVSLARGNRALDARVGAVRLGLGLRGPEVRVSRPRVACDVDRDAAAAAAPAPRKSGWGRAALRRPRRASGGGRRRGGRAADPPIADAPLAPAAPARRGGSGAAAPWVAFGAVVALMLALWPLGGLALVALALYGVAFRRRASRSRSRRRAAVSFAKPDLAARFEARDLRGDGSGAGAASVAFSLTRFGVEVLAGRARDDPGAARRRLGGGARRVGPEPRGPEHGPGRETRPAAGPGPGLEAVDADARLSVALTGECRARFYRQRRGVDTYRAALVLRGGASFEVDVANGRYAATLVDPLANDWNGRAMIREGVLELAFDGYKKDRGFPVFTATLKETRFVYEHHFIADGRYGRTPELVIRGERVALTLPESRRRLAAVRFDCRSLVAVRRGIKGVVAVPETTVIDVDAAVSGGGVATEDFLGSPCGGFVSPERRIGDLRDLRVTIVGTPRAPSPERRSSLAFLPTRASGAPQKLQFTHEIVVELSVSKKVELALTRDQYACAVALFFGNMGEDDGDGATAKWWQETPYGAGAPRGVPEAWFASGTAPHALAATLGCSWKVEVTAARGARIRMRGDGAAPPVGDLDAGPLRISLHRVSEGGGLASEVDVQGFLRVLEPGADERAAWAEATPRRGSTNALTYDHRTNCAANWVGVWLGALATTTRIAVRASLRGAFLSTARGRPLRRLAEPCELRYDRRATFATSDFDAAPYESASEASLAGKEGPVDVCGDGADARALLDVVAALARRPGARARGRRHALGRSPWAADLGRVDLSPPAHADSRGTFAARVVVRAHALAFRARRRRAELAVALTGAFDGSPSLSATAALDVRGDVRRGAAWEPAVDPSPAASRVWRARHWDGDDDVELAERLDRLVCRHRVPGGGALTVAFRRRARRRAAAPGDEGVAGGDDGLVGDDGASSDDESDDGRAGDGGDDGVFLAAVSAELGDGGGPWTFARGLERALRPGSTLPLRLRRGGESTWVAATAEARGGDLVVTLRAARPCATTAATARWGCGPSAKTAPCSSRRRRRRGVASLPPLPAAAVLEARPEATASRRFGRRRRLGRAREPRQLRGDIRGAFRAGGLACRAAATRDDRGGAAVAQEASTRAAGIAVSAEDHFGTEEEQPAVTLDGAPRRRRRGPLLARAARADDVARRRARARRRRRPRAPWSVEISLGPLLVFRNGLPVPLAWELVGGGRRRGVLPADAEAPYRGDAPSVSLRVRIANYAWSPPLEIALRDVFDAANAAARRPPAAGREGKPPLVARVMLRLDALDATLQAPAGVERGARAAAARPPLGAASAPLASVRATFRGGAALVSGALRVDGFGRRGETAFKLHDPAGVAAPVLCRLRREPRAPDDGGGGRRTGDDTLAVVERADERWPPYRIANGTSRVVRYRQKLGSATFGLAAPRRKSTYASEAYESAQSTAKYLGSKVHKGARKMGVVAASHEEQTVAPWTELRPNDEHVEFYDATRDEWGSNLNVPLDALSTAAAPSKEAKLRRAAGAARRTSAPRASTTARGAAAPLPAGDLGRWRRGRRRVDGRALRLRRREAVLPRAVADLRTEARDGNPVEPRCVAFVAPGRPVSAPAKKGLGYKMTRWTHGDDGEAPSRDELRDAIDADFEGRGPLVESDECPVVLFVFLELKRRYAGAEVVSVEVWSERLSALPLVTRLVAEEFLVPDAGGGFSTAGYALADRDADADRASSPYVCVASPKTACSRRSRRRAPPRWVADLRDAVDGAGRVDARLTLDDVASSSRVVCVVRADGPTKVLEISEEGAVRLHALDVRLTLKGGLTSTGRAEVARAFGGTSQVDAAAAAVGQLDATALGVDALLIDDAYAATAESLGRRVARHYALNLLRQVHRVCGSLDLVTKTPLHVARAVGGGLGDFLWRPVEGAATGSALGLASGVARGTGALIGGVYDGSLGAVSSLTAGVGATVAALSMDSNYVAKRAISRAAEQNAKKGRKGGSEAVAREVYRGASELGAGIFDGLTGSRGSRSASRGRSAPRRCRPPRAELAAADVRWLGNPPPASGARLGDPPALPGAGRRYDVELRRGAPRRRAAPAARARVAALAGADATLLADDARRGATERLPAALRPDELRRAARFEASAGALDAVRVRFAPGARADYAGERWLRDDGDLDALVLLFPTEAPRARNMKMDPITCSAMTVTVYRTAE